MSSFLTQVLADSIPTLTVVGWFVLLPALWFSVSLPKSTARQFLITIVCFGFAMNGLARFAAMFFTAETFGDPWGILNVVVPVSGLFATIYACEECQN